METANTCYLAARHSKKKHENPMMMGTETMEDSDEEIVFGDQIHIDDLDASILSTVNTRIA